LRMAAPVRPWPLEAVPDRIWEDTALYKDCLYEGVFSQAPIRPKGYLIESMGSAIPSLGLFDILVKIAEADPDEAPVSQGLEFVLKDEAVHLVLGAAQGLSHLSPSEELGHFRRELAAPPHGTLPSEWLGACI